MPFLDRTPRRILRLAPSITVLALAAVAGCAVDGSGEPENVARTSQRLDARVRAVGRLTCNDAPLIGVRVDMMNSNSDTDTISDQYMGTGYTDSNGNFSFEGVGGDSGSFSWSNPDVYVRANYDTYVGSTRVRVTNELDNARVDETPQHDHDNQSAGSIIQIGTRNFTSLDCALWQNGTAAVRDFQAVTGTPIPSGKYDMERWSAIYSGTPWTNVDTTHWPTNYGSYSQVNFHEFGHSVRHSLDGDSSHFNWDVTRFVYARNHSSSDKTNEGFAFNEGWAEYWATRGGDWVQFYSPANDWEVEGNVAAELKRLSRCAGIGDAKMVDVLRGHAGAIHSMEEYRAYFDQAHPNACGSVHLPMGVFNANVTAAASAPERAENARNTRDTENAAALDVVHSEAKATRVALRGVTIDTIRDHVEAGTYDAWKGALRLAIVTEALDAKRAAVKERLARLANAPESEAVEAARSELTTSLEDVDAIARSVARGDAPPLGLVP